MATAISVILIWTSVVSCRGNTEKQDMTQQSETEELESDDIAPSTNEDFLFVEEDDPEEPESVDLISPVPLNDDLTVVTGSDNAQGVADTGIAQEDVAEEESDVVLTTEKQDTQQDIEATIVPQAAQPVTMQIEITISDEEAEETEQQTPTSEMIYEVYKDGVLLNVPADLQWEIRNFSNEYNFNERIIFGLIILESTFSPTAQNGSCLGLAQIDTFWVRGANMPRLTDDWRNRNLLNPHDNLLTLMEMWMYARDLYSLNPWDELGMKQLLYWHNTGRDPRNVTNWPYSNKIFDYAAELVEIQYPTEDHTESTTPTYALRA